MLVCIAGFRGFSWLWWIWWIFPEYTHVLFDPFYVVLVGNCRVFRVFSRSFVFSVFYVLVLVFSRGICGVRGFGRGCYEVSRFLRFCCLSFVFLS